MFERPSFQKSVFGAIAALSFAGVVSAAPVAIPEMMQNAEVTTSSPARQVLGSLTDPQVIRQFQWVNCNVDGTSMGFGANLCVIRLDEVPAGRVLQLDKLTCFGDGTATAPAYIFINLIKFENLAGIIAAPYDGAGFAQGSGPYYFRPGDRVRLVSSASSGTQQEFCSVFGTLWTKN